MSGIAGLAVTALLAAAAGSPLLSRAAFRGLTAPARVVLSAAAGAVLLSFAMTLFSFAGVSWNVAFLAGTAALIAALAARGLGIPAAPRAARAAVPPLAAAAAACSIAAVLAAAAATESGAATSVDLFFFWGPKAQQFAAARGVDAAYLDEFFHRFMHPYYPPLVANLQAFAALVTGRFAWGAALATFPLLLAALAIALPGTLRAAAPARGLAAAASALAVGAVALIGIRAGIAGNGDMPLVFFEALAVALLLRADARAPGIELLSGILLAGAATAKVEGFVFALAAAALALVPRLRAPDTLPASAVRLLAPPVLALGAWFLFGGSRGLFRQSAEYGPFGVLHLEHARGITAAIGATLAHTAKALPYIVPLACLVAAGRPTRAALLPLGLAAAVVVFALFAYLHMAGDPRLWIEWSAPRVLMPVPVLLALALYAGRAGGEPGREGRSPR